MAVWKCQSGWFAWGADINVVAANGESPLRLAAGKGDSALASLLVDKGADVNAKDDRAKRVCWCLVARVI